MAMVVKWKRHPQLIIKPYQKRKKKRKLKTYFMMVLTFLILFTLTFYLLLSWLIKREEEELDRLRFENQRLRSEIKKFLSSDEAYEEYIRTKLGYIKEGEKLIIYAESRKK